LYNKDFVSKNQKKKGYWGVPKDCYNQALSRLRRLMILLAVWWV